MPIKTFVELGRAYDPSWRGIPPHMLADDLPTWTAFMERYAKDFNTFYYDVALSVRQPPPQAITPSLVSLWKKSWGKRIDAVAESDDVVWIIEVAANAFLRSLGQILTYYQIWNVKPPIFKPFIPVIVCTTIDEDVAFTCDRYGVKWLTPE